MPSELVLSFEEAYRPLHCPQVSARGGYKRAIATQKTGKKRARVLEVPTHLFAWHARSQRDLGPQTTHKRVRCEQQLNPQHRLISRKKRLQELHGVPNDVD